jgi:hypothetical protein
MQIRLAEAAAQATALQSNRFGNFANQSDVVSAELHERTVKQQEAQIQADRATQEADNAGELPCGECCPFLAMQARCWLKSALRCRRRCGRSHRRTPSSQPRSRLADLSWATLNDCGLQALKTRGLVDNQALMTQQDQLRCTLVIPHSRRFCSVTALLGLQDTLSTVQEAHKASTDTAQALAAQNESLKREVSSAACCVLGVVCCVGQGAAVEPGRE